MIVKRPLSTPQSNAAENRGTFLPQVAGRRMRATNGFTLVETLVAIAVLTIAIVAPMSLTTQSLSSAYYARDQVTAFHLAQEAIEAVRSVRDGNVLSNAFGEPADLLSGFPSTSGEPFIVDTRDNTMTLCPAQTCPPLQTDGNFYGYGGGAAGWADTRFTREVRAQFVSEPDEIRVSVTVRWATGAQSARSFTISENLFRWVDDGSAQ